MHRSISVVVCASLFGCAMMVPAKPSSTNGSPPPVEGTPSSASRPKATLVAIQANKMNVLYVGIENLISVESSSSNVDVMVSGSGSSISAGSTGAFIVRVTQPGEVEIRVRGEGIDTRRVFRAKRVPTPVARLSNKSGGTMTHGEFKTQGSVAAVIEDFDFDVRCQVASFELTSLSPRQDAIVSRNSGARFSSAARKLVNRARPGDWFIFSNIRVRCPGDPANRRVGPMAFKIR